MGGDLKYVYFYKWFLIFESQKVRLKDRKGEKREKLSKSWIATEKRLLSQNFQVERYPATLPILQVFLSHLAHLEFWLLTEFRLLGLVGKFQNLEIWGWPRLLLLVGCNNHYCMIILFFCALIRQLKVWILVSYWIRWYYSLISKKKRIDFFPQSSEATETYEVHTYVRMTFNVAQAEETQFENNNNLRHSSAIRRWIHSHSIDACMSILFYIADTIDVWVSSLFILLAHFVRTKWTIDCVHAALFSKFAKSRKESDQYQAKEFAQKIAQISSVSLQAVSWFVCRIISSHCVFLSENWQRVVIRVGQWWGKVKIISAINMFRISN